MKKLFLLFAILGALCVGCSEMGGIPDDSQDPTEQPGGNTGNENEGDNTEDEGTGDENEGDEGKNEEDNTEDEGTVVDEIVISPATMNVGIEANDYIVAVTSPCSWRATTESEWITIETKLGIDGKRELIFSVAKNEDVEPREGKIVVSNSDEGLSAELLITQVAFVPELSIDIEALNFTADGGEQNIEIVANFSDIEVTCEADWLTLSYKGNNIVVKSEVSKIVEERTADIVISHDIYGTLRTIKVTQAAFVPEWSIDVDALNFTADGGKQTIEIAANFKGGLKATSQADWLIFSYEGNNIVVKSEVSNTVEERTADIVISHDKYDISHSIKVTQEAPSVNRIIAYTTSNGAVIRPYSTDFGGAKILSNTYENNKGAIVFDRDVTSIGGYAFYGYSSLTSVTIPDSVTSIGIKAFYECSSLTSINIPNSVTSIGNDAFRNCSSLTSVTIGNGVISIGNSAFYCCSSLTSVTIPDGVTSIGWEAFYNCISLTSITIPDSVTSIGYSAFKYCRNLTSVTIPNSVTSIGSEAFNDCISLTSVTIGNGVTSIGSEAFRHCISLTSVTIPDSVTSIGTEAFWYCSSLTSVTIGNGVTSIGDYAFYECSSLTSVTIGNGVTSIGQEAFDGCSNLTSVYCKAITPPECGSYVFSYNASGRKIYVPTKSVEAYKAASGWKNYASDIVGYDF